MTKEQYKDVLLDQLDGYEKALNNAIERYKKANNLIDKLVELKYVQRSARHIDEVLRILKKKQGGLTPSSFFTFYNRR